jgi:hypothetical protein
MQEYARAGHDEGTCDCDPIEFLEWVIQQHQAGGMEYPKAFIAHKRDLERRREEIEYARTFGPSDLIDSDRCLVGFPMLMTLAELKSLPDEVIQSHAEILELSLRLALNKSVLSCEETGSLKLGFLTSLNLTVEKVFHSHEI